MRQAAICAAFVALVGVAVAQPRPNSAEARAHFVVIVHPQNRAISLTRQFLTEAFLKRTTRWPDGTLIRPVDLASSSPTRHHFVEEVMGRSMPVVRSYWQQIIFTGRGVPPVELGNELEVVAYVASHPGAVGYVSSTTPLGHARVVAVR